MKKINQDFYHPKTDSLQKIKYLIGYLDGYPIISIPTYNKNVDRQKILNEYNLPIKTIFKIKNKDVFLGW